MVTDPRVRLVMESFESEPAQSFSVDDLAFALHVSTSHLQHLFKRDTGMTIREFIIGARLSRAALLLTTTEERIRQICFTVGFSDVSNFNHAFKRKYGLSPRAYRLRIVLARFRGPHVE